MIRRWVCACAALVGIAAGGCLPPEAPPRSAFETVAAEPDEGEGIRYERLSAMREMVWSSRGRVIRITWGERLCSKIGVREGCIKLSAADRRNLLHLFGPDDFRARWAAYRACGERIGSVADSKVFGIAYVDGEQITKALDAPMGSPETRDCDRGIRAAVLETEEELVRRYAP